MKFREHLNEAPDNKQMEKDIRKIFDKDPLMKEIIKDIKVRKSYENFVQLFCKEQSITIGSSEFSSNKIYEIEFYIYDFNKSKLFNSDRLEVRADKNTTNNYLHYKSVAKFIKKHDAELSDIIDTNN